MISDNLLCIDGVKRMADLDDIKMAKDFHTDKPETNTLFALKAVARWIEVQSRLARIFNPGTRKTGHAGL